MEDHGRLGQNSCEAREAACMRSLLTFIGLLCAEVSAGVTSSDRWADLIQQADRLGAAGKLREVEECLVQALHEAESFAPNDTRMAVTLGRLGTAVWNLGKRAEAEPLYLRALKLWERNGMSDTSDVAATLSCLATIRRLSGRFREAEVLHQRSLTITENVFGLTSLESAVARKDLAADYNSQGQYKKAIVLLNPDADVWGTAPPSSRADMLNILGLAQHGLGQREDAARQLSAALRIRREILAANHPKLAEGLSNLALVKTSLREFSEAEALIEESLSIVVGYFGAGHPLEAHIRRIYAHLLQTMDRKKESRAMLQQAVDIEHAQQRGYTVDVQELYGASRTERGVR
jgi:tetratricopeptide (TPR) repeat protein